jgi:aminobenzoyl-glutamate utilization protein B
LLKADFMSAGNSNLPLVWDMVDRKKEVFTELADRVWETPETCYMETQSAAAHREMLEAQGFAITDNVANIPTALMGEAGEGGPIIAFLGEYDALAGLSQKAGAIEHDPTTPGANGHGCGHNLLGSAALLAATALKDWLEKTGTPGRVRYYGCPAEEGGAAKAFMVREGAFSDVDIAISWHPSNFAGVQRETSLANCRIDFTFTGRAAHAAAVPELGRSALDAVELMSVGVNYMREHMPSDCRIHAAIIDAGGISPNVVQAHAKVRYVVRSPDLQGLLALIERVKKVAEGAALMTETKVESTILAGVSNLIVNTPLMDAMQDIWDSMGAPAFDGEDIAFAEKIRATLTPEDIAASWAQERLEERDIALADFVLPPHNEVRQMGGSTDVGDVSWVVPTVQAYGATLAIGTQLHTWQVVTQGKSPLAHKGMVSVAKAMAATGLAALENEQLREAAWADLKRRKKGQDYTSPIPASSEPPIAAMTSR